MAVFLARGWINDAIEDEYRQIRPAQTEQATLPSFGVPVVIVRNDLSFGDTLSPEALRIVDYPEGAVPLGAYSAIEDIFTDYTARTVVLTQMRLNEPLLDYKISGPGGKGSLSARISEGYRAAAIRVDDVAGVAGFIVPGDYVDVIYTRDPDTRRGGTELIADVLLQNIKVLGIDQNLSDETDAADLARTVTVEVTNADAQRLHLALDSGKLSLTLRGLGETEMVVVSTLKASTLGKSTVRPTRRSYRAKAVRKQPTARTAQVTVIRGEARDEVSVHREITEPTLAGG
jgi:pilus assembly protein CpaB